MKLNEKTKKFIDEHKWENGDVYEPLELMTVKDVEILIDQVEQAAREEERSKILTEIIDLVLKKRGHFLGISVKDFRFYDKMFLFLASIKEFGLERFKEPVIEHKNNADLVEKIF